MSKAKPKLVLNIEFEWVDKGGIFPRIEYARNYRLKCCPDMEIDAILQFDNAAPKNLQDRFPQSIR
jgi:hypothetical protein